MYKQCNKGKSNLTITPEKRKASFTMLTDFLIFVFLHNKIIPEP